MNSCKDLVNLLKKFSDKICGNCQFGRGNRGGRRIFWTGIWERDRHFQKGTISGDRFYRVTRGKPSKLSEKIGISDTGEESSSLTKRRILFYPA